MRKTVFLRKGGGKGGGGRPPYVKYLLWAILGLSIAVVAASYLLNPKNRDTARRGIPDKPTVKKELPKPPEPAPGELQTAEKLAGGLAVKPEPAPEPPKQLEPPPPLPPQPVQPQAAKPVEPAPRDIFPKSPAAPSLTQKAPPPTPAPVEKKVQKEPAHPAAQPGSAAPEQKAVKAAPKGGLFVVQVGCYKEKQSAEEVRLRLQKKGYDVLSCSPALTGGGAYAYSVVTKPVNKSKAYSLAEQLKIEKVSPTVVAAPAACGMDNAALKAAMKKPASKALVKPASATAKPKGKAALKAKGTAAEKSKGAAVSKANGSGTAKTIKKTDTTRKSTPAAGNNSVPATSKPKTTPAKAVSTQ